ncbi:MAG: carboxynorspermidine decarboxylase [Bacteroidota bacterium]
MVNKIVYHNIPSPAYVLDEGRLIKNLELIKRVQDEAGVSIILALKAFSMWRVFPLVGQYLKGATASSLNEARLIFEEMGRKAHTYSPAYLPDEFEALLNYSSHITFNSLHQFHHYKELTISKDVSAGLRVNPEYSDVEVALYNPADQYSRLGVLSENLKDGLPEGIEGLHFHTLCESSAEALALTLQAFEEKFGHLFSKLKWVNFGGGHLMTREGYDVEYLIKILKDFKAKHELDIILEPGSAIAWETGELVATVLDITHHRGVNTAIVDVSFTAHMPDTLEMPYRPSILGTLPFDEKGINNYRIGGVSCLAGDFMEAYTFDQPLSIGDRLIFCDMIHYTMVKTTTFNGVKHPNICIFLKDGSLEVVKQFTYEDFKNRLS